MEAATLFSAKGLVVVVTGGGTGIGLAIAKALELNGAERVYILGRRLEVLENAAKQSKFGRITPLACDITSKPQLQATAERISQESGRVDVLVNNAGVLAERHEAVPSDSIEALQELLWQEDPQKWSQQFEVNVTGTFFTIIAFLKLLKNANEHWKVQNQGEGVSARRLSQVISVVGISAHHRGMSNLAGYAASKAALLHLMGLLSTLLAPLDVRCNTLSPGIYPSEITAGPVDSHNRNQLGSFLPTVVPQKRAGDEQDIAGAVLYLCGRSGWYCNGVEIITDGGRLSISNNQSYTSDRNCI
jgi:NAD(P)-dependent dehydrogenase (short-subunit alcohol dehydrogenase family)